MLQHDCEVETRNRVSFDNNVWTFDKLYEITYCPYCGEKLSVPDTYRVTVQEVYEVTYLVNAFSKEGAVNRVKNGDVEPNDKDWVKFLDKWDIENVED